MYEIGDPARYLLPDVVCDFTRVRLTREGPDRVRVEGARGLAPTPFYKVSATVSEGWHCAGQLTILGVDAVRKARRTGEALLERIGEMLAARGFEPFTRTRVEVLGESASFPGHEATSRAFDAVLRLSARHAKREALAIFARELAAAGTNFSPGTTGAGGRPGASPVLRHLGFLVPKPWLRPMLRIGAGDASAIDVPAGEPLPPVALPADLAAPPHRPRGPIGAEGERPLILFAHGRSGDKGDTSNIGILARRPEWVPWLRNVLTAERVAAYLGHLVAGPVRRHEWPGLNGFNFVCERALDGGGIASMRNDALGKAMAQVLLTMPVPPPPGA